MTILVLGLRPIQISSNPRVEESTNKKYSSTNTQTGEYIHSKKAWNRLSVSADWIGEMRQYERVFFIKQFSGALECSLFSKISIHQQDLGNRRRLIVILPREQEEFKQLSLLSLFGKLQIVYKRITDFGVGCLIEQEMEKSLFRKFTYSLDLKAINLGKSFFRPLDILFLCKGERKTYDPSTRKKFFFHGEGTREISQLGLLQLNPDKQKKLFNVKQNSSFQKSPLSKTPVTKTVLCKKIKELWTDPPHLDQKNYLRIGTINLKTGNQDTKIPFPLSHLRSSNRYPKLASFIYERTDLFAFCEGSPLKAMETFIKSSPKHIKFVCYCTGKKGDQFHESIEDMRKSSKEKRNSYIGEFVGIGYDSRRLQLLEKEVIPLPEGEKHARITTLGVFLVLNKKRRIALYSFHFDHLNRDQRRKSVDLLRKHSKRFDNENYEVVFCGDSNFFLDDCGAEDYNHFTTAPFYDPKNMVNTHYGPWGTITGDPTWNKKFLPPIKKVSDHYYRDSHSIDIILVKKLINSNFSPEYTAVFPGYINETTSEVYKLSEKVPYETIEKGGISDHSLVVAAFKL